MGSTASAGFFSIGRERLDDGAIRSEADPHAFQAGFLESALQGPTAFGPFGDLFGKLSHVLLGHLRSMTIVGARPLRFFSKRPISCAVIAAYASVDVVALPASG
jgi:hypothetical protein